MIENTLSTVDKQKALQESGSMKFLGFNNTDCAGSGHRSNEAPSESDIASTQESTENVDNGILKLNALIKIAETSAEEAEHKEARVALMLEKDFLNPAIIQALAAQIAPDQRIQLDFILDMVLWPKETLVQELQRRLMKLIEEAAATKIKANEEKGNYSFSQRGATFGLFLIISLIAEKISLSHLSIKAKSWAYRLLYGDHLSGNDALQALQMVIKMSDYWTQAALKEVVPKEKVESFFSWVNEAIIGKALIESDLYKESVIYEFEDKKIRVEFNKALSPRNRAKRRRYKRQ